MDIKFIKGTSCISLSLLLLLASTAFNCEREKDPEFIPMTFVLPFSITPISTNFNLGDTLWVEGNFSENHEEFNSKIFYDVTNFDFQSKIGIRKLVNVDLDLSDQPSATGEFEFIQVKGKILYIAEKAIPFIFDYNNKKYLLKIGLIAKQKGVFCVNFIPPGELDLRPGLNLGKTNDGRERIPAFEWLLFTINNGNTNFDLFKKNCKALSIAYPTIPNVYYEQKGTFTFEVK